MKIVHKWSGKSTDLKVNPTLCGLNAYGGAKPFATFLWHRTTCKKCIKYRDLK